MANGIWRLTVRSDFAAAHALRNYCGKCENIHGHNFAVEAVVEGDTLSEDVEILLDFKVLKTELKAVLELLDHKDLNTTPPFDVMNPSSENLARFIYKELEKRLAEHGVRVYSITVSEKTAQSATYLER
ncbi:MAG: 6-carboxytetrahydropterin synthase QueD [Desulfovibrionales bacterium]|nr:6-carboxytetrahydropterin synthase QueD [Desulfovibrionales bacterium]